MTFENKISSQEIYYSRYIASYVKMCRKVGVPFYYGTFKKWLESIGLPTEEVYEIANLADNGKLELETSARKFLTIEKHHLEE